MTDKPSAPPDASAEGDRIVIRDKRKINPASGTESAPAAPQEAAAAEPAGEPAGDKAASDSTEAAGVKDAATKQESARLGELQSALDERTADLQRLAAEYANYRKRVGRVQTQAVDEAVSRVLETLLPVLDNIDSAREHGDLTGPFASVAEQLNTIVGKFGLTVFGAKGDVFDPKLHDAVAHLTATDVKEPTCIDVMRRGYLLGERLLRPAMVAVADPAPPGETSPQPQPSPEPEAVAPEADEPAGKEGEEGKKEEPAVEAAEKAPEPEPKPESE